MQQHNYGFHASTTSVSERYILEMAPCRLATASSFNPWSYAALTAAESKRCMFDRKASLARRDTYSRKLYAVNRRADLRSDLYKCKISDRLGIISEQSVSAKSRTVSVSDTPHSEFRALARFPRRESHRANSQAEKTNLSDMRILPELQEQQLRRADDALSTADDSPRKSRVQGHRKVAPSPLRASKLPAQASAMLIPGHDGVHDSTSGSHIASRRCDARSAITAIVPAVALSRKRQRSPPPETFDPELVDTTNMTPEEYKKLQIKIGLHRKLKERVEMKAAMHQKQQHLQESYEMASIAPFVRPGSSLRQSKQIVPAVNREPASRSNKKKAKVDTRRGAETPLQLQMFDMIGYDHAATVMNPENMTFPPVWDEQASSMYYDQVPGDYASCNLLQYTAQPWRHSATGMDGYLYNQSKSANIQQSGENASHQLFSFSPNFDMQFISLPSESPHVQNSNSSGAELPTPATIGEERIRFTPSTVTTASSSSNLFFRDSFEMLGGSSSDVNITPASSRLVRDSSLSALATSFAWPYYSSSNIQRDVNEAIQVPECASTSYANKTAAVSDVIWGNCVGSSSGSSSCGIVNSNYPCILSADSGVSFSPFWASHDTSRVSMAPSPATPIFDLYSPGKYKDHPALKLRRKSGAATLRSSISLNSMIELIGNSPKMNMIGQNDPSEAGKPAKSETNLHKDKVPSPSSFTPKWDATGALEGGQAIVGFHRAGLSTRGHLQANEESAWWQYI